ncbi:polyprenyl synthetase family protein [Loigolactobacillus coryniformis]|uniref:Farnesyl diphosphate synthase n=1 Tax=Loigolactobacillus coryniformis TaxID=1610 RepID=A0A5B8TG42_9LACO|nr:farnesyl diphosphate synthase [Loigolactobacillus coryniformis]MDT3390928.1 polyprenyl synthetase family protein [Bacillota bacterium]QEA53613.1 polyprenyl synthetase family protein [Loigolactobacillus coryniformis]RRG05856.1 MAG: polyprenyl synthetase family protein [Lactobacillus sp.]
MIKLTDFRTELVPALDSLLSMKLHQDIKEPALQAAMTYSVMAGGKRVRPLLLLAVVQTFQASLIPQSLPAAAAIELIHTYSLIHDDLPAMDNDDLRRGQATNHKKFGEALAILAGDGLQPLAFQWLSDLRFADAVKIKLIRELALGAGPLNMVAGQVADMQGEHKALSLTELKALHRRKTGALLKASLLMGAVISELDSKRTAALSDFADHLGLAFQIKDDILDVTSTAAELGKPVHQDQAANKNTYPGLLGLDGAQTALTTELTAARRALDPLVASTDISLLAAFLTELAN